MFARFSLVAALLGPLAAAASNPPALAQQLSTLAPEADPAVLKLALDASECAQRKGLVERTERLAVIDYSRPSTERRLWVFDIFPWSTAETADDNVIRIPGHVAL